MFLFLKKSIKSPQFALSCFVFKINKKFPSLLPDSMVLKALFYLEMGYKLNLKNPRTFNEKLQWLKLYYREPMMSLMVDKYEVKKYVSEIIGEKYIIPTLGVWNTFDEIDFNTLPNQFVLKVTHDSGGIIIVKNKEDINMSRVRKILTDSLNHDFYQRSKEWPYKNVKRRIIAEKLLIDPNNDDLKDYKFMCFNGKVLCSFVCSNRNSQKGLRVTFFDREWKIMPFSRKYPIDDEIIKKPQRYTEMVSFAEKMSQGIPFVRIDFYEVEGNIFFGEYTFFPGSGMEKFTPFEWDKKLGDWVKLKCK